MVSQPRQLHADLGVAAGREAVVTDDVAQQARQDRCQGGAPRPVRDLPACGSGGPEGAVHRDPAADRATASQTGTDMTRSRVTDDPLRRRTRRELRLEARLRRSSATDTSALHRRRTAKPIGTVHNRPEVERWRAQVYDF